MNKDIDMRKVLGIDENTYNDLVIDTGVSYLSRQHAWTKRGLEKLKTSRVFWQWWWRNWRAVDSAILKEPLDRMDLEEYMRCHVTAHAFEMPRTMWRHHLIDEDCRMVRKVPTRKERLR